MKFEFVGMRKTPNPGSFFAFARRVCAGIFAAVLAMTVFSAHASVLPEEDYLWICDFEPLNLELKADVTEEHGEFFAELVETGSELTSFKLSGLPSGLKFNAKTYALSGAPTKSGIYWVTAQAKNKNGYEHSRIFRFNVLTADGEVPAMPEPVDNADIFDFEDESEYICTAWCTGEDVYYYEECGISVPPSPLTGAEVSSVKVSGLPAGVTYYNTMYYGDGEYDELTWHVYFEGMPSKPGIYTVTFSVTYDDRKTLKSTRQYLVADGGSSYVTVAVHPDCEGMGTATGSGVYKVGAPIKLAAKSANGCAFAGWYVREDCSDGEPGECDSGYWPAWLVASSGKDVDYRTASGSFAVDFSETPECSLYASFVSKEDDVAEIVVMEEEHWEWDDDAGEEVLVHSSKTELDGQVLEMYAGEYFYAPIYVISPSLPKVTVKGLPKGAYYYPDSGLNVSGDVAPGIYPITITAVTSSKLTTTANFHLKVMAYSDFISVDGNLGEFTPGEEIEPIDLSWCFDFENNSTFKVSGLPKGLSWNAKANPSKGIDAYTITGTPTEPGEYLVVFSAKIPYETETGKMTSVLEYSTASITVMPYPELAVAVYTGYDLEEEDDTGGSVTGAGNYPAGKKVTLKAKPADGYVFAGWLGLPSGEEETYGECIMRHWNPSVSCMTEANDTRLEAMFIPVKEDYFWIDEMSFSIGVGEDVADTIGEMIIEYISTCSLPSVSVNGLPSGLKWDAKTLTLSGKASKEGVYYVTFSGKNASGYAHSRIVKMVVGDAEEAEEENGANISEDEFEYIDERLRTGVDFDSELTIPNSDTGAEPVKVAVKGLPAGVKSYFEGPYVSTRWTWDEELSEEVEVSTYYEGSVYFEGMLAKPGRYTLTIDVTYDDKSKAKTVRTITVRDSGSRYVDVSLDEDSTESMGSVSGAGVYAYGQPLKISAKANKGYVFAGWYVEWPPYGYWDEDLGEWVYEDEGDYGEGYFSDAKGDEIDYRTPSLSKALLLDDLVYTSAEQGTVGKAFAKFVTVEEDAEIVMTGYGLMYDEEYGWSEYQRVDLGSFNWDTTGLHVEVVDDGYWSYVVTPSMKIYIESKSLPGKLSVTGVPAGFKFTSDYLGYGKIAMVDESKMKPGVYTLTATVSNASKAKATKSFKITVPNLTCDALPYLNPAANAYVVDVGQDVESALSEMPDLSLGDGYEDYDIKVSGLPAGVKMGMTDICCGMSGVYAFSGTPTKPGAYTVTFTATKGSDKQVATITLNVAPLPEWLVGTFSGMVGWSYYDAESDDEEFSALGSMAVTIGETGKFSAKVSLMGATSTFAANGYAYRDGDCFVYELETRAGDALVLTMSERSGISAIGEGAFLPATFGGDPLDAIVWRDEHGPKNRIAANSQATGAIAAIAKTSPIYLAYMDGCLERVDSAREADLTLKVDAKRGTVACSGKVDGISVSGSEFLKFDVEEDGYYFVIADLVVFDRRSGQVVYLAVGWEVYVYECENGDCGYETYEDISVSFEAL